MLAPIKVNSQLKPMVPRVQYSKSTYGTQNETPPWQVAIRVCCSSLTRFSVPLTVKDDNPQVVVSSNYSNQTRQSDESQGGRVRICLFADSDLTCNVTDQTSVSRKFRWTIGRCQQKAPSYFPLVDQLEFYVKAEADIKLHHIEQYRPLPSGDHFCLSFVSDGDKSEKLLVRKYQSYLMSKVSNHRTGTGLTMPMVPSWYA